jgi:hypothetical protein
MPRFAWVTVVGTICGSTLLPIETLVVTLVCAPFGLLAVGATGLIVHLAADGGEQPHHPPSGDAGRFDPPH